MFLSYNVGEWEILDLNNIFIILLLNFFLGINFRLIQIHHRNISGRHSESKHYEKKIILAVQIL